jgi:phosphohistidine phosphatase
MKQLLLVRHAKSDWDEPQLDDFDRPLNKRGHKAAPEMAARLAEKKIVPEMLVSSPALRAITTAKYFAKEFGYAETDIVQEPAIYESSVATLLKLINEFPSEHNFISLFGHNPGLTNLAIHLADFDVYNIPTCGMVLLEFPFSEWKMISNGTGIVKFYDYPKNENG